MPPKRRDTLPKSRRRVPGQAPIASAVPRRISRREREERRRRQLYFGIGIAGALIVLVLAVSAVNEYWIKPRHVLASVDGTEIRRRDYWKYRAVDLANQASQYASIAQSSFVTAEQAQQYSTLAQQTSAEIDSVWGSTSLDESTLQKMIDDQVYLQSLDDFGIMITDQDVQDYIDQQFQPAEAPIFTPTPTPTLIPERAAWVTQTAVAAAQAEATPIPEEASPAAGSPESGSPLAATPVDDKSIGLPEAATPIAGSPRASPVASSSSEPSTPFASPIAASPMSSSPVAASPVPGTPAASPEVTMEVSPTPNQEQARQTATANFEAYKDAIFDRTHLSRSDYIRLIVKPAIARERINQQLTGSAGQSAEQVQASHILVDTKDLADSIYQQVTHEGADFAQIAKDQSVDSGTAPNGGDLGWFTKGQMVDAFEEAAFNTPPGQISQPVQTEFGWHIIKVVDHVSDRAMTDEQINQVKTAATDDWLAGRKAELDIESEIKPTPTPSGPENFVPPPDAPPTPTPTAEVFEPTPLASPGTGNATPIGSPAASPIASPVGS